MTLENSYNALPEGFKGEQQRRTEFASDEEKVSYDANGLIALAKQEIEKEVGTHALTVNTVMGFAEREEDQTNTDALRVALHLKLEQAQAQTAEEAEELGYDPRLKSLIVDPINDLPEKQRTINGIPYTGEEIANALPNVEAFLKEVNLDPGSPLVFLEINEAGQLVMMEDPRSASQRSELKVEAEIRQTRVVYTTTNGEINLLKGQDYFEIPAGLHLEGVPSNLPKSTKAKQIPAEAIILERGLPTMKLEADGRSHSGEAARMGLVEGQKTWVKDTTLQEGEVRYAWVSDVSDLVASMQIPATSNTFINSIGVLRAKLDLPKTAEAAQLAA